MEILEHRASKSGTIAKSVFLDRGTSLVYVKHIIEKKGHEPYEKTHSPEKIFLRHSSEPNTFGKINLVLRFSEPIKQAMP